MRTVVTGGTGFIGSHVVDKLLAAGHQVTVVDLRAPHRSDVDHHAVDISDLDGLVRATAGADAVFHLAAFADVNDVTADPVGATEANVLGTMKVWEACRRNGVKRAILASTVWVYGGAAVGEGPLDETASFSLKRAGHLYTSSKLAAELVVQSCHTLYGQEFTILRYGIPYGPRMRPSLVIPKFVSMALKGEPITIHGDGSQHRNYVYVEELAQAHVLALGDEGANEVFNLEGTERVTIRSLVHSIGDVLGAPVNAAYLEGRAGDYEGATISADKADRVLGWKPAVPFSEGLRRYVDWHLAEEAREPVPAVRTRRSQWRPRASAEQRSSAIFAGIGLSVAAVPALSVAATAPVGSRAVAGAATVAACVVWWLARRSATRVPVAATVAAGAATVWLVAQAAPRMEFVALGLLLGLTLGSASPREVPPTWLGAGGALGIGALALAHLGATPVFYWVAALLVAVGGLGTNAAVPTKNRRRDRIAFLRWAGSVAVATAVLGSWVEATSATASWFGPVTDHGSRHSGQVAITFDGTLTAQTATAIFDTLQAFGAKATIYAPARAVLADPAPARRVVDRGDLLAEEGSRYSWIDPRRGQLARLQQTFQSTVGVCPTYFHPPGGRHSPLVARAAHSRDMKLVTWDVSVPRGSNAAAASIARDVLRRTKPGSIIFLPLPRTPADDGAGVVAALPDILRGLRARHLVAVRLDDLLGAPGYAESC